MDTTTRFLYRKRSYGSPGEAISAAVRRISKSITDRPEKVTGALQHYVDGVIQDLRARHSKGWPGGTSGNTLSRRSGELLETLEQSVAVSGRSLATLTARFQLPPKVAIHETGGTVSARSGSYLTIPLPAALDSRGVPKTRSARDWKDTFVGTSQRGNLLIFQKTGASIKPLYVLKKSVKIKARLGLERELTSNLPYFASRLTDSVAHQVSEKVQK